MPQLAARIHRLEHSGCCLPLQQFWWAWYHGTEHRVHQQLWTASWYTEWFAHSSARLASGNASSPSIQFHFEGFDKTINLRPQFSCHKSQADTMCYDLHDVHRYQKVWAPSPCSRSLSCSWSEWEGSHLTVRHARGCWQHTGSDLGTWTSCQGIGMRRDFVPEWHWLR